MRAFHRLDGIAAPLPYENVDTDKIIAARFLKTITREGLGQGLFHVLRQDPQFVLRREPWASSAEILVALDNFGCGSSREHAPWALLDFGIRCIIAPSFADIFYNNCFKNGILPIVQPEHIVRRLLALAADPSTARMQVDLEAQAITLCDGAVLEFALDAQRKNDLLEGADEIERALRLSPEIDSHENRVATESPWLGPVVMRAAEIGAIAD